MTTQLNKETREYLIKLVAGISAWEYANGHDGMAERFNKILPTLILHSESGDTVLEEPEYLADMICTEYQSHIEEFYQDSVEQIEEAELWGRFIRVYGMNQSSYEMAENWRKFKARHEGGVTVVKEITQDKVVQAIDDLLRHDPKEVW